MRLCNELRANRDRQQKLMDRSLDQPDCSRGINMAKLFGKSINHLVVEDYVIEHKNNQMNI